MLLSHECRNAFARSDMQNRGLDRYPYHRNKPPRLPAVGGRPLLARGTNALRTACEARSFPAKRRVMVLSRRKDLPATCRRSARLLAVPVASRRGTFPVPAARIRAASARGETADIPTRREPAALPRIPVAWALQRTQGNPPGAYSSLKARPPRGNRTGRRPQ